MAAKHISLAEAKAKLSAIVDGVLHRGEHYLIERHGRGVAALVGVADLERVEQMRATSERPGGALPLVGLWHDVPDEAIDALITDLRATRDRDRGRPVALEP